MVSTWFPFYNVFVCFCMFLLYVANPALEKNFVEFVAQRLQTTTTKFEDPKESKDVSSDENGPQDSAASLTVFHKVSSG